MPIQPFAKAYFQRHNNWQTWMQILCDLVTVKLNGAMVNFNSSFHALLMSKGFFFLRKKSIYGLWTHFFNKLWIPRFIVILYTFTYYEYLIFHQPFPYITIYDYVKGLSLNIFTSELLQVCRDWNVFQVKGCFLIFVP